MVQSYPVHNPNYWLVPIDYESSLLLNVITPGLLPGDDIMLFIFARQVRDMRLCIVMIVVTTSELNSVHNGGECQPAVTDHCEIQSLKYTFYYVQKSRAKWHAHESLGQRKVVIVEDQTGSQSRVSRPGNTETVLALS